MVLPQIERHGAIEAWIIDDTGFPKQGRHSVGVARQYCGQLGKQDNCQVAVSLSLANHHASLPVAYQLYLPQEWADHPARRRKAGVPEEVTFKTKPQIALEQLRFACVAGLPRGVVLIDAGYGNNTELRGAITALGLSYAAGICSTTTVWAPGMAPLPASSDDRVAAARRRGCAAPADISRSPSKPGAQAAENGVADHHLARGLRRATDLALCPSARLPGPSRWKRAAPYPEEWLLIEWPEGEPAPTKYWLSTLPDDIDFAALSIAPSCAGASNATIRTSSRRSASAISKAAAGVASITTPPCASLPTAS